MKQRCTWLSTLILILGFSGVHLSHADELSQLKGRVTELEERLDSEMQYVRERQDADDRRMEQIFSITIYVALTYQNFENENAFFKATDLELLSELHLNDQIGAYFEIEFEGGEAEVEQGYLEYIINEKLITRYGVILIPFGRYNLEHFSFKRDLVDTPIAMRHIVPSSWSEAGAGFIGNVYLGGGQESWFEDLALDYQFFIINGLRDEGDPPAGEEREGFTAITSRQATGEIGSDNNNNKGLVGRVGMALPGGRELGISGYIGKYDDGGRNQVVGYDIDWLLSEGPFELIGEYVHFDLKGATTSIPSDLRGAYVQGNFHFWFDALNQTILGKRYETPTFTAMLRYGHAKITVAPTNNEETRWTVGLNYRPDERFVAKLAYQWNNTENTAIAHGNNDGLLFSITSTF